MERKSICLLPYVLSIHLVLIMEPTLPYVLITYLVLILVQTLEGKCSLSYDVMYLH